MFNCTGNIFEGFRRKEDGYALRTQANELAEVAAPVDEKEEVAAKMWDRSAVVDEAVIYKLPVPGAQ